MLRVFCFEYCLSIFLTRTVYHFASLLRLPAGKVRSQFVNGDFSATVHLLHRYATCQSDLSSKINSSLSHKHRFSFLQKSSHPFFHIRTGTQCTKPIYFECIAILFFIMHGIHCFNDLGYG